MSKSSYGEEQSMFLDYYKAIRGELDNSQRGQLLDAMVYFLENNNPPNLDDPLVRMGFGFIRNGLERVTARYEHRKNVNRSNVNKRWGNE